MNIAEPHRIPELAVSLALEHHNSQREMTSRLISDIYGDYLDQTQIAKGFDNMLNSLGDLSLDTPDAPVVSNSSHTGLVVYNLKVSDKCCFTWSVLTCWEMSMSVCFKWNGHLLYDSMTRPIKHIIFTFSCSDNLLPGLLLMIAFRQSSCPPTRENWNALWPGNCIQI